MEGNLTVGYVTCPLEKRLLLLFTFLKRNRNKKVAVVFNSLASAKYHSELFERLELETTVVNKTSLTSLNTTNLIFFPGPKLFKNLPVFDWCIFYDPINNIENILPKTNSTKLLLILQSYETGLLNYLNQTCDVNTEEFKFTWNKITNAQLQIEKLVGENYFLNVSAKEAFKRYLIEYNNMEPKEIFNVKNVELKKLCLSFGFKVPVRVDLTDDEVQVTERRVKRKGDDGYAYDDVERNRTRSEYRKNEDAKKFKIYKPVKSKAVKTKKN